MAIHHQQTVWFDNDPPVLVQFEITIFSIERESLQIETINLTKSSPWWVQFGPTQWKGSALSPVEPEKSAQLKFVAAEAKQHLFDRESC